MVPAAGSNITLTIAVKVFCKYDLCLNHVCITLYRRKCGLNRHVVGLIQSIEDLWSKNWGFSEKKGFCLRTNDEIMPDIPAWQPALSISTSHNHMNQFKNLNRLINRSNLLVLFFWRILATTVFFHWLWFFCRISISTGMTLLCSQLQLHGLLHPLLCMYSYNYCFLSLPLQCCWLQQSPVFCTPGILHYIFWLPCLLSIHLKTVSWFISPQITLT